MKLGHAHRFPGPVPELGEVLAAQSPAFRADENQGMRIGADESFEMVSDSV